MDCTLCPLLVTAISFFDLDTAILSGKSPNGKLLPAGDNVQPFGRVAGFAICAFIFNAMESSITHNKPVKDLQVYFLY
jgi:hypothetical protein